MAMVKKLVDIDEELLAQAAAILGAETMKETVNRSLAEIIAREVRRRHAERLRTMDGLDLDDPDVMTPAWR